MTQPTLKEIQNMLACVRSMNNNKDYKGAIEYGLELAEQIALGNFVMLPVEKGRHYTASVKYHDTEFLHLRQMKKLGQI